MLKVQQALGLQVSVSNLWSSCLFLTAGEMNVSSERACLFGQG
jgi:hypothetical protein